ncbi:MAG: DNA-processing protein DprA [Clostridia bacterium]|nr:DNA-processing protein DprA [Clostridia bacterium]
MRESLLFWIWLQRAVGPGSADVPQLLASFKTAREVWNADRMELERAGITGRRLLDALCRKSLDGAKKQAELCSRLGWMLTPEDGLYPAPLRQIYSPPLVLYGKGRLPDFSETATPAIGMVGTRKNSRYGEQVAAAMAAGLAAAGCPIISGGARGIDRASHEGTLYAGGHAVIVQACGLNVEYPYPNRDLRRRVLESGGAIITEFLPDTKAFSGNFRIRNRLISGMAHALCVVEAPTISGALITARTAREQGRDVFVVPGRATDKQSEGSHALIREGAVLVTRPSQLLEEYPHRFGETLEEQADRGQAAYYEWLESGARIPSRVADAPTELPGVEPKIEGEPAPCPDYASEGAKRVYAALEGQEPLAADVICELIGLTPGEVFAALTELELYGCVDNRPGKRYAISIV